jgi:hypothetical protein
VEVEGHEEALMDVVVLCKLRPATLKRKEKIRGGAAGAAGGGAIGPGATPVTLGLFLLPRGRSGRRLARASKEVPAAASVVFLFLLPRGRPQPRGASGEPRVRREPSASAMRTREKPQKTLDGERR